MFARSFVANRVAAVLRELLATMPEVPARALVGMTEDNVGWQPLDATTTNEVLGRSVAIMVATVLE